MPTAIDVTFRVVTPLFGAGAEANGAELRLPSFKGVLRYWWRALAWSRLGGDLEKICQQEDCLFGSARGGQSRVLLRMAPAGEPPGLKQGDLLTISADDLRRVGDGARYLGYGVMTAFPTGPKAGQPGTEAGVLTRTCLRAPFDFTVHLHCRDLDKAAIASLGEALKAVGTLGGLGAKSRKGYGSLALRSLRLHGEERWSAPQSFGELHDAVAALRPSRSPSGWPEFTALSGRARHVLVTSETRQPLELLDLVGRELVRYRSWGHNGKILGSCNREEHFEDDHDLMKLDSSQRKQHPRRIAFGLPHNYFFSQERRRLQVGPWCEDLDRRASPLFIHIHACGERPVAVLSFLPARFLPKDRSIISVDGARVPQAPEDKLYEPIHDFLDRLLNRSKLPGNQRREPFTEAVEVGS